MALIRTHGAARAHARNPNNVGVRAGAWEDKRLGGASPVRVLMRDGKRLNPPEVIWPGPSRDQVIAARLKEIDAVAEWLEDGDGE
jgi:hypothetical protein